MSRRNARIMCANGNAFWVKQRSFWRWVRENRVKVIGHEPLTGTFLGEQEDLVSMIKASEVDGASPSFKREIRDAYRKQRR